MEFYNNVERTLIFLQFEMQWLFYEKCTNGNVLVARFGGTYVGTTPTTPYRRYVYDAMVGS